METCHLDIELSTHQIISFLHSEEEVWLAQDCIKFVFLKLCAIFYSLILRWALIFYRYAKTKLMGILLQQREYFRVFQNFFHFPCAILHFLSLLTFWELLVFWVFFSCGFLKFFFKLIIDLRNSSAMLHWYGIYQRMESQPRQQQC